MQGLNLHRRHSLVLNDYWILICNFRLLNRYPFTINGIVNVTIIKYRSTFLPAIWTYRMHTKGQFYISPSFQLHFMKKIIVHYTYRIKVSSSGDICIRYISSTMASVLSQTNELHPFLQGHWVFIGMNKVDQMYLLSSITTKYILSARSMCFYLW